MYKIKLLTALFFSFCLLTACEDCTFTSKNTDDIVLGFFAQDAFGNALPKETVFDSIRTGALHLAIETTKDKDGKRAPLKAASFNLPADPTRDTSEFYFFTGGKDLLIDTVIFLYRRKIQIITPDCGYDLQFSELTVLKNTFAADSVAFPKNVLTVGNEKNMEIYTR